MSGARERSRSLSALVPYLQTRTVCPWTTSPRTRSPSPTRSEGPQGPVDVRSARPDPDRLIEVDFEAMRTTPRRVGRGRRTHRQRGLLARPVRLGTSEAFALIVAPRALAEGSPAESHEVIDRCLASSGCRRDRTRPRGRGAPGRLGHRPAAARPRGRDHRDPQARLDYYVPTGRGERAARSTRWAAHGQRPRLPRRGVPPGRAPAVPARPEHAVEAGRGATPGARAEPAATFPRGSSDRDPTTSWPWCTSSATPLGPDYYPSTRSRVRRGAARATLRVGDPRWLVRLALRLAPAVTVVEPPGLRERLPVRRRPPCATRRDYAEPHSAGVRGR